MAGLMVRVNGKVVNDVVGFHYTDERLHTLRVVHKVNDRIVADDYEVISLDVKMTGVLIDYRLPVLCESPEYTGVRVAARLKCVYIDDEGILMFNYPINAGCLKVHISKFNVDRVKKILAKADNTAYLELSEEGFGRILDRQPEEDPVNNMLDNTNTGMIDNVFS